MSHWVQVKHGLVVNVWDSPPKVPVGEEGWMNAVENIPTIDANKQKYGNFTFDINSDPVVISREVFDLPVDERKQLLLSQNESGFIKFFDLASKQTTNFYTEQDIAAAKTIAAENKSAINAATTHAQLDKVVIKEIPLF